MKYTLTLVKTEATDGFFSCVPEFSMHSDKSDIERALAYLERIPNDDFMHKYALRMISSLPENIFFEQAATAVTGYNRLHALFLEALLTTGKFANAASLFQDSDIGRLSGFSPLVYLRSKSLSDGIEHNQWIDMFRQNVFEHRTLPSPDNAGMKLLFAEEEVGTGHPAVDIRAIVDQSRHHPSNPPFAGFNPVHTCERALAALEKANVLADMERRHTSSICPIALLRQWKLGICVRNGDMDYSLAGIQTSYGKGLSLVRSRASCLMEAAERFSSFASVEQDAVLGLKNDGRLAYGSYEDVRKNRDAVDPNQMCLEVPYENQLIYWIEGTAKNASGGDSSVYVPAQAVLLFCNLDEPSLFSGIGSTGLASGNTKEEARLSALHEIIERDASSISLFDPGKCFTLTSGDPQVGPFLRNLKHMGVHLQFQDMTTHLRVPCYKSFVIGGGGRIFSGWGCHLDAERAIVSAITEIPYPYGVATERGMKGLPVRRFEDLPNYSGRSPSESLVILESVLEAAGYRPVYVDLTRQDIDIPVVRAIVPGLEILNDFDQFARVSRRLFAGYLKLHH